MITRGFRMIQTGVFGDAAQSGLYFGDVLVGKCLD